MAANNTYGIVRPALVSADDVEIFYAYRPTRNSEDESFKKWRQVSDVTSMFTNGELENPSIADPRLPGMYNLRLPVSIFGNKGIYTVFIRPKEIRATIKDVGSLTSFPGIRGIVIDMNTVSSDRSLFENDNMVGYRVEYLNYENDGLRRQEYYRIVTSSNLCEPVSQNMTTSNTTSNGYRYSATGSLSFITLTPSTAPSFRPNGTPYIGVPNQQIILTHTKFDPLFLEIDMVNHDIETVSTMLEGNVIRDLDHGRVSYLNDNQEIYKQFEFYTLKNNYTSNPEFEVKRDVSSNIDTSMNIDEILS